MNVQQMLHIANKSKRLLTTIWWMLVLREKWRAVLGTTQITLQSTSESFQGCA